MAIVVAVLVIAVVGAAAFVTKAVWFKLMAELSSKPPQLRHNSGESTEWQEDHRRRVAQLPAAVREAHNHSSESSF